MKNNIAEKYWYYLSIIGLLIVYVLGLFVDIMDVDAAQYASIAREMAENGDFLQVKHRMGDYLDKPPLLFWLSSLSFQIFGVNNWAYKLPSFLSTIIGIFSLYKFTCLFYNRDTAKISAVIYASCQALILINNDVRTDTLLCNSVIFSIWQVTAYLKTPKAIYFLGSALGLAFGLLAKGPLGLMIPILAFGTHFIVRKEWNQLYRPAWYGIILLSLVIISPMVYGLYEQYGSYGPYFYFWEQSFGRLTGENAFIKSMPVRQEPSPFFFTHTFLWTFLPFSLFAVFGIAQKTFKSAVSRFGKRELITIGGIVFPFIAMSLSKYKLPHYIYPIYPLVAILTTRFILICIDGKKQNWVKFIRYFQYFVSISILLIGVLLASQLFGFAEPWIWVLFIVFVLLSLSAMFSNSEKIRIVFPSVLAIVAVNIIINGFFYPQLLKYQGTVQLANFIKSENINPEKVYTYKCNFHSLDFYSESIIKGVYGINQLKNLNENDFIIVPEEKMEEVKTSNINYTPVENFYYYPITLLKGKFLSPDTREKELRRLNLIKLK